MQFWVLDCIPDGVIEYCFYHEYQEWRKVALSVLGAESIVYRDLCVTFNGKSKNVLLRAIRANRVEIVRFLASVSLCASLYHSVMTYAARMGKLESLRALHECNVAWDRKTCAAAAAGGHLECLQYAHENGCDWDEATLIVAALYGHLECLMYAFEKGCASHPALCRKVAQGGNLNCLEYLVCNNLNNADEWTCAFAAQGGHLDALKYLFERGCPWDEHTVDYAARAGKLQTLQFAIQNGCPHGRYAVSLAAGAGSLPCLQYLVQTVGVFVTELENVFASAMLTGHHECFAYLLQVGFRINDFGFLSEHLTELERECIAQPHFDNNFLLCLSHAMIYSIKCDHFVYSFVQMYNLQKCMKFLSYTDSSVCVLRNMQQ